MAQGPGNIQVLNSLRSFRQVMRDVRLSRKELEETISKRLKATLVSAFLHVPYYRQIMQNAGYNPVRHYRGPEDLALLPVTTKEILKQADPQSFVSDPSILTHCHKEHTSGSTGIPLVIYRSNHERSVQIAKWLRVLFLNGYSIFDKVMSISSPERLTKDRSFVQRFGIFRRLPISWQLPTEAVADHLMAYKPNVLYGDRSIIDLVALDLRRRGLVAEGVKLVVETGGVINENSRDLCRERFGVELIESYGSAEMGVMAYETAERNGLELCEDLTFFEFLNDKGLPVEAGEPGRMVVTDLTGKLMPFIRYDQGDLAVFKHVDGVGNRAGRKLTRIIGRQNDYVLLPDGTLRSYDDFNDLIGEYKDIFQFRVVQQRRNAFQVFIVAENTYFLSIRDDLLARLRAFIPGEVEFKIIRTDQLERDPGGKMRMFISEVLENDDGIERPVSSD